MHRCREGNILEKIKKFAGKPKLVSWSRRALDEIFVLEGLTRGNILEAIVHYIDDKKPVEERIMTDNPKHKGEKAYVLKPDIEGTLRYIKLQFININGTEKMHIFSAHNK